MGGTGGPGHGVVDIGVPGRDVAAGEAAGEIAAADEFGELGGREAALLHGDGTGVDLAHSGVFDGGREGFGVDPLEAVRQGGRAGTVGDEVHHQCRGGCGTGDGERLGGAVGLSAPTRQGFPGEHGEECVRAPGVFGPRVGATHAAGHGVQDGIHRGQCGDVDTTPDLGGAVAIGAPPDLAVTTDLFADAHRLGILRGDDGVDPCLDLRFGQPCPFRGSLGQPIIDTFQHVPIDDQLGAGHDGCEHAVVQPSALRGAEDPWELRVESDCHLDLSGGPTAAHP